MRRLVDEVMNGNNPEILDEVYFFGFADDRVCDMWGLEDTWTRMRQLAGDDATLGELGSLS